MNKVILITGQTATGKTKLAFEYAQKYNGELVNCDSRQIYKYLDIITGKDIKESSKLKAQNANPQLKSQNFIKEFTLQDVFEIGYYNLNLSSTDSVEEEQSDGKTESVKLWLYDVITPDRYFSSFDYQQCALWVIKKILSEGKTPIIVGGTYLYLKHLLYEVETEHIPPNWNLRKKFENTSVSELQKKLKELDVLAFNKLNDSDKNNPQRLIRKIEIIKFKLSNQHIQPPELNLLSKQSETKKKIILPLKLPLKLDIKNFEIDLLGLKFKNKESLRKAIEKRVERRLKEGAIEEVKKLLEMGYSQNDPGLKTIGYQQLLLHLKGERDLDRTIQDWITKEIQYAKRQYTFMKKDPHISWKEI